MRIWVVGLLALGCGGDDVRPRPRGSGGDDAGVSSAGNGGANADASTSGGGGSPSTGGKPACSNGNETCACYGNGTCNAGLVCASNLCVRLTTGGGGMGAGGSSSLAGGTTSSGGAPPIRGSSPLGGPCVQNVDCRPGLGCLTPNSTVLDGGGPPGGLCTTSCTVDGDCAAFEINSICVEFDASTASSFCLQRCDQGVSSISKCRDRTDMVCGDLIDQAGNPTDSACQPSCRSDRDCPGRRCDFRTGYCISSPSGTLPIGSPCNPNASIDQCNGVCVDYYADSAAVPFDPKYSSCFGSCSLSVEGFGCGVDATTLPPFDSSCLGPATATAGDAGLCFQLCDCDGDCRNMAFVCRPWTDTTSLGATGRQGYCRGPLDDQGLIVPNLPCGP